MAMTRHVRKPDSPACNFIKIVITLGDIEAVFLVLFGALCATVFGFAFGVLLELPRGFIQWSVGVLYAAGFVAVYCLALNSFTEDRSSYPVIESILAGTAACFVMALAIKTATWVPTGWEKFCDWKNQ